jgi:stage V sporulation protein SpoVS
VQLAHCHHETHQATQREIGAGAVETAPAAVAVLTAYTLHSGLGWFGLPTDKAIVDIDEVTVQSELFEIGAEVEEK